MTALRWYRQRGLNRAWSVTHATTAKLIPGGDRGTKALCGVYLASNADGNAPADAPTCRRCLTIAPREDARFARILTLLEASKKEHALTFAMWAVAS